MAFGFLAIVLGLCVSVTCLESLGQGSGRAWDTRGSWISLLLAVCGFGSRIIRGLSSGFGRSAVGSWDGVSGFTIENFEQWPQARRWIFILLWLVIGVVRPAQAQGIVYEYSAITEVQKGLKLKVPVDSTLLIVMLLKLGLRQASGLSW